MSGHLNSHIWASLHSPGSKEVSIRMLSPQSLKQALGSSDKDTATQKKDFEEVSEITVAMNTLTHAVHCIHPWNFAFATLDFFLTTVQYGEKDITSKSERISFLCSFIDEVIQRNANAWDDSKPFLTAADLSSRWLTQIMMRYPRAGPSGQNQRNNNKNKRKNDPDSLPPSTKRKIESTGTVHPSRLLPAFQLQYVPEPKRRNVPGPLGPTQNIETWLRPLEPC
jgi:hypothetical protein